METVSEQACFGGVQGVYRHASESCGCDMTFGLFLPPQAREAPVPLLWYLSGLTCTHENAMLKSGAQAWAARAGLAVAFPDTSPRGDGVADDGAYDLGQGAGFYVDATEAPWAPHFAMWRYVTEELPALVFDRFPLMEGAQGITGHSMGGHGALTVALTLPERFRSLSAFAPIAHPTGSDWGRKQFAAYLGPDEAAWAPHDASLLLRERGWKGHLLVDQGTADPNLDLLRPEALMAAIGERRQAATVRMQPGYDHGYFFVASFMEDHIAFHAEALLGVIYVDADACPVRDEVLRVAERHGVRVTYVTNGGIRPSRHPLAAVVVVEAGADAADKWIAERIAPGDVCVTADVPLAARCVAAGARAVAPDGASFTPANVGGRLAMRDLMADLRAADPFRPGGGRLFSRADRARFLEALEATLRAAARAADG